MQPFVVLRSFTFTGLTQSGHYVQGVQSLPNERQLPWKFDAADLSMKDTSLNRCPHFRRLEVCHRRCAMGKTISACLAWGDGFVNTHVKKVMKRLSLLRHHGTPMMAHLQFGDRVSRESSVPGNARVCGSIKATAIWSFRHCKPAACILGLTGANMRLSLIRGFP